LRQRRKLRVRKLRERKPRENHHRKSKRKSKKEKEGRNREKKTSLIPGNCCRLQVHNAERGPPNTSRRVPTKFPGILTSIPSMNTHFFRVRTQSNHGSTFYRKLQDFLQEVLYFYQKHPVEPLGRPESIMERDLKLEVC